MRGRSSRISLRWTTSPSGSTTTPSRGFSAPGAVRWGWCSSAAAAGRLAEHEATFAAGCRLDPDRLAGLACRLAAAIEDGADLVIIKRFGRSEAEGKGVGVC